MPNLKELGDICGIQTQIRHKLVKFFRLSVVCKNRSLVNGAGACSLSSFEKYTNRF